MSIINAVIVDTSLKPTFGLIVNKQDSSLQEFSHDFCLFHINNMIILEILL